VNKTGYDFTGNRQLLRLAGKLNSAAIPRFFDACRGES